MALRDVSECYYVSPSRFVMLVVIVLDGLWSWRFALHENPCRWFPREVAVLRSCLYSPSTSQMSGIGTLCVRVHLSASRVDRQFNSSALG